MQNLSNIILLDFCEWLHKKFILDEHNEINPLEVILNEKDKPNLFKYAKEYIEKATYSKEKINHYDLANNMKEWSLEMDFFNWVIEKYRKPIKFDTMTDIIFEALADEYCNNFGKNEYSKKKLIQKFKKSRNIELLAKFLSFLIKPEWKHMKSLEYIVARYTNNSVEYKCIILPLRAESEAYKELMGPKYWYDLNYLSGEYLDIFYSQADYGRSGYEIENQLNFLPEDLIKKVPSIIIWESDMSQAQNINIDDLNNPDIFKIIRTIVEAIQQRMDFTNIIEEANNMAKELRNKNRPIIDQSLTIGGDNLGIAVSGKSNMVSATITNDFGETALKKELEEAIPLIRNSVDINERQKEVLVNIILEAKNAVEKKDEDSKKESKSKFKHFMIGLGDFGVKLLSAFSAMDTLAKFFNL